MNLRKKYGVLDCSIEVPSQLRYQVADFPPIFRNCEVSRDDIGSHMRTFTQTNNSLRQSPGWVNSSFNLERGPIITPPLNVYLGND